MSKKSSSDPAIPERPVPSNGLQREGYVPFERKGYTPVASAPKLPKAPQGGTGQSSPKPAVEHTPPQTTP